LELSLTETVAVAPLGTEASVAMETVRVEELFCAIIVVGENCAPPIRTEFAVWKANALNDSGATIAGDKETIDASKRANLNRI